MLSAVLIHDAYALGSFMMGYLFITVQQFQLAPNFGDLPPILLYIVLVSAILGRNWYCYTQREPMQDLRKSRDVENMILFMGAIGGACTIFAFQSKREYFLKGMVLIFITTCVFIYLDCFLNGSGGAILPYEKTAEGQVTRHSKRITLLMPLVFNSVQFSMFGCSYAMIIHRGLWGFLGLYAILVLYLIWWRVRISASYIAVNIENFGLLIISVVFIGAYFLVYYNFKVRPGFMETEITLVMKALAVSIYYGGVVAIPGLMALSQIQQSTESSRFDYEDRSHILTGMTGAATVAAYITWVWLRYTTWYLFVFMIASTAWIAMVKYRNVLDPHELRGIAFQPYVCLLFTAGFLSTEFLGCWNDIEGWKSSGTFEGTFIVNLVCNALGVVIKIAEVRRTRSINKEPPTQDEKKSPQGNRILEVHFLCLFITAVFLRFCPFPSQYHERVHIVLQVIAAHTMLDIGMEVIFVCLSFSKKSK